MSINSDLEIGLSDLPVPPSTHEVAKGFGFALTRNAHAAAAPAA